MVNPIDPAVWDLYGVRAEFYDAAPDEGTQPSHIHGHDHVTLVLEGRVLANTYDETTRAVVSQTQYAAGCSLLMRAGVRHDLRAGPEGAKFVNITKLADVTPANLFTL
jgi:quercetin dioxygenase-like cupin family protein